MDLEAQEELRGGEWRRASMEELPRCEMSAEPGWEDVAEQGRCLPDGDIGLGSVGLQVWALSLHSGACAVEEQAFGMSPRAKDPKM